MMTFQLPGVYRQDVFPAPQPVLLTGVPIFLGYTVQGEANAPHLLTVWPQFDQLFGPPVPGGYLWQAVRGFFENEGLLCYVLPLAQPEIPTSGGYARSLQQGLEVAETMKEADLICVPDLAGLMTGETVTERRTNSAALQQMVLEHCRRVGDCFAILDVPLTGVADLLGGETAVPPPSDFGALYYPWLITSDATVPPCGHVAGLYSRSDQTVGPHKPPANEQLFGVFDLQAHPDRSDQSVIYAQNINNLAAFPGRGIRVMGARTGMGQPISARRLLITVRRWLEQFMTGLTHEPNDFRLWVRIMREVTAYLDGLFRLGALKGRVPEEAFYVKCDGGTNSRVVRETGQVVTEVGLAPVQPSEFIVVRIVHGDSGVTISGR